MPSVNEAFRDVVRTGLFGRDANRSLGAVLVAISAALTTWVLVATTVGADRLATLAVETWTGQSAHLIVLGTAAVLLVVAATSAAVNSGFVPTYLLVAGPLLGIGLARYGTEYALFGSTYVVSLGEAFADGAGVAVGIGLPLAVVGFLLGVGLRRLVDGDAGGSNGRVVRNGV